MVAGIDVSHHQFVVNWADVAATEIRFCFIKATEGASSPDPRFAQNWTHHDAHPPDTSNKFAVRETRPRRP